MQSRERDIVPEADVPLAPLSSLGVGGRARWFVRASSRTDVAVAHQWCVMHNTQLFVLGGGSNLVIADAGFDGLVLHMAIRGAEFAHGSDATRVHAGAGEPWDHVVAATVERGLSGLECLSGIPGSVGGTPIQNVGAYGQEVAGAIESVSVFDRKTGAIDSLSAGECDFTYRSSRFKVDQSRRFVVTGVTFRLQAGAPTIAYPDVREALSSVPEPAVGDVRRAVLSIRKRKGMLIDPEDPDTRSVGSFFMNPIVARETYERLRADQSVDGSVPRFPQPDGTVKIPAAWLIEHCGFRKGHTAGGVGLSSKHPLAVINRGEANAGDVIRFAAEIKRRVADRFGVNLQPEPVFVGFSDNAIVDYLLNGNR